MKKIVYFILCCLIPYGIFASNQIQPQLAEEESQESNATWIGPWAINCQLQKFPTALSSERYGNGYRTPVYICSATQTIYLLDQSHNLSLTAKITPFYMMFKLNNGTVDNRYTKLFVGNKEPWHLYANCYDIPNDQSCVFWLGDKNDFTKVERALLGQKDFMVQMTEKNSGQAIHFIFPLQGYSQIYSALQEASTAVHYAYVGLTPNPNFD
jgi:hypothetical protein